MGRWLGPVLRGRLPQPTFCSRAEEKCFHSLSNPTAERSSENKLQFEGEEDVNHGDLKALVWDFWDSIPSLFPGL